MAIEIVMPSLGLTMTEGVVHAWLKRVGDTVQKDEPVVSVETDKAVTEVVSPADGVLGEILVPEGATVPVQQVIAILGAPGEVLTATTRPSTETPTRRETLMPRPSVSATPTTTACSIGPPRSHRSPARPSWYTERKLPRWRFPMPCATKWGLRKSPYRRCTRALTYKSWPFELGWL